MEKRLRHCVFEDDILLILNIIKKIIILSYFLMLFPVSLGTFYGRKRYKTRIGFFLSSWVIGFMLEYTLFGVICVSLKLLKISFHADSIYFVILSFALFVLIIFLNFTKRIRKNCYSINKIELEQMIDKIRKFVCSNPAIVIFTAFLLLQFLRTFLFENQSFLDDKTYNSFVLSILKNNIMLYTIRTYSSSIYEFEAFLSYVSGVNNLIICNTIWRGYIILLYYAMVYLFADELFETDTDKKVIFCTLWAIFNEATFGSSFSHDTLMLLRYANWAKGMIILWAPLFFLLLHRHNNSEKGMLSGLLTVASATALCLTNNGGASTVFLIVFGETISYIILNKKIKRAITMGMLCVIPPIIQIISYVILERYI